MQTEPVDSEFRQGQFISVKDCKKGSLELSLPVLIDSICGRPMAKTLEQMLAQVRSRINEVDAQQLHNMMQEKTDLLILDVREYPELEAGCIGPALHVPRGVLEGAADLEYDKRHPVLSQARQRPIVAYCHSGVRSAFATDVLNSMGFVEVYNLAGGFMSWVIAELPLSTYD